MSINKICTNFYEVGCDICEYETYKIFNSSKKAIEWKKDKSNGWISKKINGQWHDICPECSEEKENNMFEELKEFPRQGEDQAAIIFNRSEYNDEGQYIQNGEEQGEKSEEVNVPEEKPWSIICEQGHFHNIDPAMYPIKLYPDQKKEDAIQGQKHNSEDIKLYPGDMIKMNDITKYRGMLITIKEKLKRANEHEEKNTDPVKLYPGDRIMIKCIPDMLHKGEWITIVGENKKYEDYYYCLENTCFWCINHLDTSTLIRADEQKKQQAIEPQVGDIVEWESIQEKYVLLISEYRDSDFFRAGMSCYKKNCIKRILYRLGEDYIEKAPNIGVNK